ncbi:MAG: lipocalin-like domain-containing protein [Chloroflexota bacterium]
MTRNLEVFRMDIPGALWEELKHESSSAPTHRSRREPRDGRPRGHVAAGGMGVRGRRWLGRLAIRRATGGHPHLSPGRHDDHHHRPAGRRPLASADPLRGGPDDERRHAAETFVAYAGAWALADGDVVHTVTMSLYPNWVGTRQVRHVRMLDEVSPSGAVHRPVRARRAQGHPAARVAARPLTRAPRALRPTLVGVVG